MPAATKLIVNNIRSHRRFSTDLSPKVTVITGKNGSGKTSLLEAIFIALQGSSFKGVDSDLLRAGTPWWRVELALDNGTKRVVTFNPDKEERRKVFVVDNKTTYRLPIKSRYPIVLFEPDDLRLLHGSPLRRRQFIDRFIGQLNPSYTSLLHKYERALRQRNNLLKKQLTTGDELFVWDIALSQYGADIIEQRTLICEQINAKLNEAYCNISGTKDSVSVHYSHTAIGDIKQKLLRDLALAAGRDRQLGSTSVGPHRHDIIFQFNNSPALSTASRGEVRTIVLAIKFIEVDIVRQQTGIAPIILLDDVFSELDVTRQQFLLRTINSSQIVITSAQAMATKGHKFSRIVLD